MTFDNHSHLDTDKMTFENHSHLDTDKFENHQQTKYNVASDSFSWHLMLQQQDNYMKNVEKEQNQDSSIVYNSSTSTLNNPFSLDSYPTFNLNLLRIHDNDSVSVHQDELKQESSFSRDSIGGDVGSSFSIDHNSSANRNNDHSYNYNYNHSYKDNAFGPFYPYASPTTNQSASQINHFAINSNSNASPSPSFHNHTFRNSSNFNNFISTQTSAGSYSNLALGGLHPLEHSSSLSSIANDTSSSFGYTPQPGNISSLGQRESRKSHFGTPRFFNHVLLKTSQDLSLEPSSFTPKERPSTPPDSSVSFEPLGDINSGDRPESMRTLYFGNLPPDISVTVFLNHIRGGVVEELKYLVSKSCVFVTFLDACVAAAVYLEYVGRPFTIEGYEVRVGWGKPSSLHPGLSSHIIKGASRNVFVGDLLPDQLNEAFLERTFICFGGIDCIKILPEKRIAFVHLLSISAAIKAVMALSDRPDWRDKRIYYGRDRCCTQTIPHQSQGLGLGPEENRTVYIGGIHPDVTTKELCDVIRGGLLQQIKYFAEKNICFATFIWAESAALFYTRAVSEGLVLRSKRLKIGWGKPSVLPAAIASAVEKGASRNVYVGSIDESITKQLLYDEFIEFGEIELVNIIAEKRIGFVSFADITSAIKAVDVLRDKTATLGSESVGGKRRVNFGKDRCANAFRPAKVSVSPPASPPPDPPR